MRRKYKKNANSRIPNVASVVLTVMCFAGVTFGAQQARRSPINTHTALQQAQGASTPSEQSAAGPEALHLIVDRSLVITSPVQIKRVSLANPNICDAIVVSPREILLNGKKAGATSLVIWGQSGEMQTFDVYVDLDVLELSNDIRNTFPNVPVKVQVSKDLVTLSGHVSSPEVADKILELAQSMVPRKEDVVSLLEVPAPPTGEVLLKVRFAEVDRSAITTFGVNLMSIPPAKNVFTTSTQQFSPPGVQSGSIAGMGSSGAGGGSGLSIQNLLNIFIFRPDINLAATIQALQTRNLLQILAEPNVLTQSGKPASFISGGEFPYPVIQSATTGFPAITIQFHQFGVRLDFTPTITQDGYIHLKVKPEVSSLDYSNALVIQGFTIPAISTRRVESEMDLRDGQSFVIAGLMDNRVTRQLSKVPGLGDIPLLGKIFQSYNLNKSKTELLVLVTPQIVHPLPPGEVPSGPQFPMRFLPPVQAPKGSASGR
ncbi:MAG: pilus assembly protein N-terminal domain-containing protein [Acidobacteria bacterium]|nr:pilus assembly protein N-terminal domain-containing protein [Acidobacteriota bacterium]